MACRSRGLPDGTDGQWHDGPMHRLEPTTLAGREAARLVSPAGVEATFVPSAAMLGASLRDDGTELLWPGEGIEAYERDGRWFGIPLLHPWANRLAREGYAIDGVEVTLPPGTGLVRRDARGRPIHGVMAGGTGWSVVAEGADASGAWLGASLDFTADPARARVFPFPHTLRVDARLSERTLRVTTTLEATGDRAVPVAFGWHPYLMLPGVPRSAWHVTLPVRTHAELDGACLPTGTVRPCVVPPGPLGERTYDDLFPSLEPGAPFVLAGGERRIEVRFGAGYDVAVVYAPGHEALVCFEPMTAPTDPFGGDALRRVAPGERFRATFEIAV